MTRSKARKPKKPIKGAKGQKPTRQEDRLIWAVQDHLKAMTPLCISCGMADDVGAMVNPKKEELPCEVCGTITSWRRAV